MLKNKVHSLYKQIKNDSIRANNFLQVYENNSKKNEKYSSLRIYLSNRAKIPVIYTLFNLSTRVILKDKTHSFSNLKQKHRQRMIIFTMYRKFIYFFSSWLSHNDNILVLYKRILSSRYSYSFRISPYFQILRTWY